MAKGLETKGYTLRITQGQAQVAGCGLQRDHNADRAPRTAGKDADFGINLIWFEGAAGLNMP